MVPSLPLRRALLIVVGLVCQTGPVRSATAESLSDERVIAAIDSALAAGWRDSGFAPSKPAPDGAWARRVYLDVLGRTPTLDELRAFVSQRQPQRRAWLVDRLFGEAYRDERASWRAVEWTNLLIGRTGGQGNNSLAVRGPFEEYLYGAFAYNRPYNELMRELVTATGSVRPQDDDHNPAANFLADKMGEGGVQATAKTASIFLGTRVQCTQCHNHPFNEGRQNQFWELNAFFRQTRAERVRDNEEERPKARITDRDFYGEGRRSLAASLPSQAEAAEIYYELRNGKLKVAYPVFLDGTALADVYADRGLDHGDSGRLAMVNRRDELASLIAASSEFDRTAVNREWGRFFGYGFTRPIDDLGEHNPPSHPELLDTLAEAFRDSGHNLDRLARWIVSSRAYGLDSRARGANEADEPANGTTPLFSRFYLRQLSAEQIYESLITATRADETLTPERREAARRRWLRQFATAFGNDENGETTTFDGSIPQALAMMNGELTRRATYLKWAEPTAQPRGGNKSRGSSTKGNSQRGSDSKPAAARPDGDGYESNGYQGKRPAGFLSDVAANPRLSNAQRVEELYLAALARKPDRRELALCNRLLAARDGNAGEALRDIWWALLNSNEFILQH